MPAWLVYNRDGERAFLQVSSSVQTVVGCRFGRVVKTNRRVLSRRRNTRELPIVSFDVVRWDDGTFTFSYRDFRSQTGIGISYIRYRSVQELAEQIHKITEECREGRTIKEPEEAI